jgi:hypothetical protein
MNDRPSFRRLRAGALCIAGVILMIASGCARDTANPVAANATLSTGSNSAPAVPAAPGQRTVVRQDDSTPPASLVTAQFAGSSLRLWPFTGNSFDARGVDPINLVFVGHANPAQIRDALLGLDGDRTALGFPGEPPFNQRWKDGFGDVQTCYAEPAGWVGSEIQLTLGDYDPVRFHLRLFRTANGFGEGGWWTVGAAHFEVMIPGTTEHQVLSWERAEEIVAADLMRSGLLDAGLPAGQIDGIGPSPSWRDIPTFMYNELPAGLIGYINGPAAPVTEAVPLTNDGKATVLNLARSATPAGGKFDSFTIQMRQVVPRPFCNGGPLDYVLVQGPVSFEKAVFVDSEGKLSISGRASGLITVTPVDVTQSPPVPSGSSWTATVGDQHEGNIAGQTGRIMAQSKRILPQDSGTEMIMTRLMVASNGQSSYSLREQCLSEELTP